MKSCWLTGLAKMPPECFLRHVPLRPTASERQRKRPRQFSPRPRRSLPHDRWKPTSRLLEFELVPKPTRTRRPKVQRSPRLRLFWQPKPTSNWRDLKSRRAVSTPMKRLHTSSVKPSSPVARSSRIWRDVVRLLAARSNNSALDGSGCCPHTKRCGELSMRFLKNSPSRCPRLARLLKQLAIP